VGLKLKIVGQGKNLKGSKSSSGRRSSRSSSRRSSTALRVQRTCLVTSPIPTSPSRIPDIQCQVRNGPTVIPVAYNGAPRGRTATTVLGHSSWIVNIIPDPDALSGFPERREGHGHRSFDTSLILQATDIVFTFPT